MVGVNNDITTKENIMNKTEMKAKQDLHAQNVANLRARKAKELRDGEAEFHQVRKDYRIANAELRKEEDKKYWADFEANRKKKIANTRADAKQNSNAKVKPNPRLDSKFENLTDEQHEELQREHQMARAEDGNWDHSYTAY